MIKNIWNPFFHFSHFRSSNLGSSQSNFSNEVRKLSLSCPINVKLLVHFGPDSSYVSEWTRTWIYIYPIHTHSCIHVRTYLHAHAWVSIFRCVYVIPVFPNSNRNHIFRIIYFEIMYFFCMTLCTYCIYTSDIWSGIALNFWFTYLHQILLAWLFTYFTSQRDKVLGAPSFSVACVALMCLGVSYFVFSNLYFILPFNFEVLLFVVLFSSRIWFALVANVAFSIMSGGSNNSTPFVFYSKSLFFPLSSLTFLSVIHNNRHARALRVCNNQSYFYSVEE